MQSTLLQPKITEKSMRAASLGVFTFLVAPLATKTQVSAAVTSLFKVDVVKVRLTRRVMPIRRTGARRLKVTTPSQKLAMVWLKKGQSISLFDLKETN